jgi:hypothetical protein
LIELLVVVGIIALLISILMPSLGRARQQAKAVHCLARFHDIGTALVIYGGDFNDSFPPALWHMPDREEPGSNKFYRYGWSELLWSFMYREEAFEPVNFPVQRNTDPGRWAKYFTCKTADIQGKNSGHYRVYLPSWSYGSYAVGARSPWELQDASGAPNYPDPTTPTRYANLRPKLILLGDANERSYRGNDDPLEDADGDGHDDNDGSWIDPDEANESGKDGNRFSDRHYGNTNFLYADMHAEKDTKTRERLARDWDMNGIDDIEEPDPTSEPNEDGD